MPYCWRWLGRKSQYKDVPHALVWEKGGIRGKVLRGCRNLLVGQALEDVRDNLVYWLLVMRLQPVLVLAVELLFREVEVQGHLLVLLELHDKEGIPGLTLTERRIQADTKHEVGIVGFREDHEFLDGLVLDLVVVRLATETERSVVHIDVEPTSAVLSGRL